MTIKLGHVILVLIPEKASDFNKREGLRFKRWFDNVSPLSLLSLLSLPPSLLFLLLSFSLTHQSHSPTRSLPSTFLTLLSHTLLSHMQTHTPPHTTAVPFSLPFCQALCTNNVEPFHTVNSNVSLRQRMPWFRPVSGQRTVETTACSLQR